MNSNFVILTIMAGGGAVDVPIPAELDVFAQLPPRSHLVDTSFVEEHQPVNFSGGVGREGDIVDFWVRGTEHWVCLPKCYWVVRGSIVGNDGVDMRTPEQKTANAPEKFKTPIADNQFRLERNFVHTLFSSIAVYVCDKPISPDNQGYQYAAYFFSLCNFTADYLETVGVTFGWAEEEPASIMYDGNRVELILQPRVGFFQSVKNLIPFVDFRVVFSRATNPLVIFKHQSNNSYRFNLESMVFKVRKVKVWDEYTQSIEQQMSLGRDLKYKFREPRVFTKMYNSSGTELIEDHIFHGLIPQTIIFGFVPGDQYNGLGAGSIYSFTDLNGALSEVSLLVNGLPFPVPTIRIDAANKRTYEAYHTFMDALFAINSPDPPMIKKSEYDTRSLLFAYNMAPDQFHGLDSRALTDQNSNIRLHVKFSKTVPNVFVLVVMYEAYYDLSISKHRMVTYGPSTYHE